MQQITSFVNFNYSGIAPAEKCS